MPVILAFDVYGTLIDTHGVTEALEQYAGADAGQFSRAWREKQLEYAFRRGLMRQYRDFSVCTSNALDYTCMLHKVELSAAQKQALLKVYSVLPVFDDVKLGLSRIKESGFSLYAFSNGTAQAVELLLGNAGIREFFSGIVSVDEVRSFKPDPAVYRHFLKQTASVESDAWLISGNAFDVLGAMSVGMRSAWLQRSPDMLFDPWGVQPTITINNLANLAERIIKVLQQS